MLDGVRAREDEPVVAEEVFNRLVELGVGFGRDDLDGRAGDDARAESFERGGELRGLRARARDHHGAPRERRPGSGGVVGRILSTLGHLPHPYFKTRSLVLLRLVRLRGRFGEERSRAALKHARGQRLADRRRDGGVALD